MARPLHVTEGMVRPFHVLAPLNFDTAKGPVSLIIIHFVSTHFYGKRTDRVILFISYC